MIAVELRKISRHVARGKKTVLVSLKKIFCCHSIEEAWVRLEWLRAVNKTASHLAQIQLISHFLNLWQTYIEIELSIKGERTTQKWQ